MVITISEQDFAKLCDDAYRDRELIYSYNPNMNPVDCLEWMILGCLITLLSIEEADQANAFSESTEHPYGEAIVKLLENRMTEPFDADAHLKQLSGKLNAD
jgi:hypothetical protein